MTNKELLSKGTIFVCPKDNTVKEFTVESPDFESDREKFPCEKDCDILDCPIKK